MDASDGVPQLTVLDDQLGVVDDEVRTRMLKDDDDYLLGPGVGAMAGCSAPCAAPDVASVMQEGGRPSGPAAALGTCRLDGCPTPPAGVAC